MLARDYLKLNRSLTTKLVCQTLSLARSSFYAAKKAKKQQDRLDQDIFKKIEKFWEVFPGLGYRKLTAFLNLGGFKTNGKRVLRILKKYREGSGDNDDQKNQAKPKIKRFPNLIKRITKDLIAHPEKQKRDNWVLKNGQRNGKPNKHVWLIEPTRPYQLWAGDWKELKVPLLGATIYIFVIIDCYTRQLKGWNLSLIKDGKAAVKASMMAIRNSIKNPLFDPRKLIMHTDQGSAYLSEEYEAYWKKLGVSLSMTDKGKPSQNPYIEAFFSILVRFWLNHYELLTIAEIRESLEKFFNLYNGQWLHGEIGNITPDQRLKQYQKSDEKLYLKT